MSNIDILYLGVNMANAGYRFFCRYPEAVADYYNGFKWLARLKQEHTELDIAIKHHSGDYDYTKDDQEVGIVANTGIRYIDSHMDSYKVAMGSKVCVSYCSTMILELNGYSNMAKYLWQQRHNHIRLNKPCKGNADVIHYKMPAYYLDPQGRNRQFCKYIDDVHKHDCSKCINPPYLEIFEPYRLTSYEQFKSTMEREVNKYVNRN